MKRSRFSEEQIIAILKEQESGMTTADVCRHHGISAATPAFAGAGSFTSGSRSMAGWRCRMRGACERWSKRTLG